MGRRIYRRRVAGWKAYAIPAVLWVASTLWMFHVAPGGLTAFNIVLGIVGPGMIFGIWLLTVFSINHYGATTISTDTMTVGRTAVPLDVLDREWVLALARTEAPAGFAKFAHSAGTIQVGGVGTLQPAKGRLIGGAFAIPLGAGQMTLRKTNGEMITMPVKDRAEALGALLEAFAERSDDGPRA